jgi:hypothetical protein
LPDDPLTKFYKGKLSEGYSQMPGGVTPLALAACREVGDASNKQVLESFKKGC